MKWAFEGKLTNKDVKVGELPEGWKWTTLGIITDCLDNLRKPVNKDERLKRFGEIPYYGANGRTGWIDDYIFDEPLILVVEDETFVGRVLPFSYKITGKSWVNNHAHILKPKKDLHIDFLNYQLYYYPFLPLTTGTTGRKKLTKNALVNAPFKICSKEEQISIVQEIESRLSVCDKLEETINNSIKQAETLRQSILKQAFEGKLVVHDFVEEIKSINSEVSLPVLAEAFPKTKEGIRPTDLHAGIIAMIIDAHEKNPKHKAKLNHVKCEKIVHMVEYKLGISLGRVPVKDAAGPNDYKHLKQVEHRANMINAFGTKKLDLGFTYYPKASLQKAIDKVALNLTNDELKQINDLIQTFLPFELEHAEVIATLFAAWNNLLLLGQQPTEEQIVYEARENWSARKLTIERSKFFKTLEWMKSHGYVPEGRGKTVEKPKK